jgi:hypothetical protein
MSAIYGARFLDMWQAVDPADVQIEWSHALAGIPRDALTRAVARLYHTRYVPTLPEFIELCAPVPAMHRQPALALDSPRTSPEQAREQLAEIRDLAAELLRSHRSLRGGDLRWAYRLLQRAADGEHITAHQIGMARDAIEGTPRAPGGEQ